MAIILKEEGLYDRCQIYATDFNHAVIQKAKEGIYPISKVKEFTYNYQKAGGINSFSDYYTAKYESAILNTDLKKNIVFADHNLVTDKVFAEVHLVMCRNVLIYFDRESKETVVRHLIESLAEGGYLVVGPSEGIYDLIGDLKRHSTFLYQKVSNKEVLNQLSTQ